MATQVQISDEVTSIPYNVDIFGKGMNSTIFSPSMTNRGMATSL